MAGSSAGHDNRARPERILEMRSFKFILRLAVSLGISGFFIWLSLRHADLQSITNAITRASHHWVLLSANVALLLLIHLWRTLRWGLLLAPLEHVPFARLNRAAAIGFLALMVLPLRLGEFARPYLIAGPRIRKSEAMVSVVVERVIDGLVMALVLVVALFAVSANPSVAASPAFGPIRTGAYLMMAIFGSLLIGLAAAWALHDPTLKLLSAILSPVSPRLAARATEMIDNFIGALKRFPSASQVVAFFALTILFWGTNVISLMVLARAFEFELTPLAAVTVMGAQVVGVMIPAGPGAVGTMQFFTQLGLSLFLSAASVAGQGVAFANACWALTFGQQILTGLFFLATSEMSFGSLLSASQQPEAS